LKRVLITGANSYVGTNVEKWLMKEPENFYVETLDMKNPNWREFDFSKFEVVFHVAGIAHVSTKKSMSNLYFKVNRDLTIETALKAKESGVRQFIFMSSMIVYNSKQTRITKDTKPKPDNFYGLSKLQAEQGILPFQSEAFNVIILRPPMIYGPKSKGNFGKLIKIANRTAIFPLIKNKRSALYIYNLCKYINYYIDKKITGIQFPQNNEYFSTYEIIVKNRKINNKKTILLKIFNPLIIILKMFSVFFNKLFGDYYYDINEGEIINKISFDESLVETIKGGIFSE
jgi:nucleoside-diphosphate-sugar epimerase